MAGPNSHQPVTLSRRRPNATGDEEATAILRLGEMEGVPTISVAECNTLLDSLENRAGRKPASSDIYVKTREYCKVFARFKGEAVKNVDAVTQDLVGQGENGGLTLFERAQLGMATETNCGFSNGMVTLTVKPATLCCDTAEEARTLIPSLEGKLDDDTLQQVLDEISKYRDFSA